jgi:signal transduction histidine kinase
MRDDSSKALPAGPDYRVLFSSLPHPCLLLDSTLKIADANPFYLKVTGRTATIIGMSLLDAFPTNPDDPDSTDVAGLNTSIAHAIATGQPHSIESLRYAVPRQTEVGIVFDERFWNAVHTPILGPDGAVAYISQSVVDVTDQIAAAKAALETQERVREGMTAARMVIWDMDLETGAVIFSNNATALFGRDWDSQQAVWQSLHAEDLVMLHAARARAIIERGEYHEVVRLIRDDSQGYMWLDVKGRVQCDARGAPVAIKGVSVDITERMRAEQDLRDADRRKDEFLAMLAHELRNPLAPISAAAQLLKMPALSPDMVRKTSEVIGRQVGHMTSLVDDLLDVSRVTRGLIDLDRKRLVVTDIVSDAVEQVRPLITSRRQDLSVVVPQDTVELDGDQKRLVQVLTNLLNNAAKYTPDGGRIELTVTPVGQDVTIAIRDNGIGIPHALLPHVFDLFTQAERTPDRSQGGLGLGLALVRSLVALHGGTVTATSEGKDRGSVFSVHLPCIAAQPEAPGRLARPPHSKRLDRRLRLLVVDDNMDAAEMLGAFMESAGHEVAIEYEPFQAMERARVSPPDVCLLDIGLPGMDGNQLARCLRLMPQLAETTLIAVTGYGKEFDRETSIAAGFDYYFVKPADPVALVALLDRIDAL